MEQVLVSKIGEALALLQRASLAHRPVAFASSLSAEDMLLTDLIARHRLDIGIFTLDTGRLHGDTLQLVARIRQHYGLEVRVVKPDPRAVSEYVVHFGRDAFYRSVELRKRCCEIRKVEPLERALAGHRAWITGLRREQSPARADLALEEFDAAQGLLKFNPLADWSEAEVWACLRGFDVPYNPLYDQGYRSIGCAPCTRPAVAGEDPRAGRWWWEPSGSQQHSQECGLHVAPDGRLVRARVPA